ncbi:MAG: zinc-dependent metalloprotease [Bacteroidota bacterium]
MLVKTLFSFILLLLSSWLAAQAPDFSQLPAGSCVSGLLDQAAQRGYSNNDPDRLWPGGIIPYYFANAALTNADKERLVRIMGELSANTNLCFFPQTDESEALDIERRVQNFSFSQNIGYVYGDNLIVFGGPPNDWLAYHEIGHSLGFWHEHQRPDRDSFVEVRLPNIDPDFLQAFNIIPANDFSLLNDYDYESVMHYFPTTFSRNGQPTLASITDQFIAPRFAPTSSDLAMINQLYPNPLDCDSLIEAKILTGTVEIEHPTDNYCLFEAIDFRFEPLTGTLEGWELEWLVDTDFLYETNGLSTSIRFDRPGRRLLRLRISKGNYEETISINLNIEDVQPALSLLQNPPQDNVLRFRINSNVSEADLFIFDSQGRRLYQQRLLDLGCETEGSLELPPLPRGIYTVSVWMGRTAFSQQLLIL